MVEAGSTELVSHDMTGDYDSREITRLVLAAALEAYARAEHDA